MTMAEKLYLRRLEAARYLGVHPNTLINWEKSGVLAPTYIGGSNHRRYPIKVLDIFKNVPPEVENQHPEFALSRLKYLVRQKELTRKQNQRPS